MLALLVLAAANWSIVPGRSIGHVYLGEDDQKAVAMLGKAASGDAAMGKFWSTYLGNQGGRIDLHATRNSVGDHVLIDWIRVTSAKFLLPNGLHAGMTLDKFQRAYPHSKSVTSFTIGSGKVTVWNEWSKGIAWESDLHRQIIAISVHKPRQPVRSDLGAYISEPLNPPE